MTERERGREEERKRRRAKEKTDFWFDATIATKARDEGEKGQGRRALKNGRQKNTEEGKNRQSCKEGRREGEELFSITWLAVRVCVDPGGFRETKRVITRPRASAVPSNPLTHSPTPRAERLSSLSLSLFLLPSPSLAFRSLYLPYHIPRRSE